MSIIDKDVTTYINGVQPLFGGVLGEIQRECLAESVPVISPETARFLAVLLSMKRPARVLEVGCAVGFSAGLMCGYLAEGGHITTIDRYDIMIRQAKVNFARMGIEDRVTLMEGDAGKILPTLTELFDLIFLDAAKGQYIQFLPHCLRLLKVGGLLLADDVMQSGRTAMDRFAIPRRQRTIQTRLHAFLQAVEGAAGLESAIVPIGDGLLMAHKTRVIRVIE